MKRKVNPWMISTLCLLALMLCSFKYYDKSTRPNSTLEVTTIKHEGHYFTVAATGYSHGGVSIIHSPVCNCNSKR